MSITPLGTRQYHNPTLSNSETRQGNYGLQPGNASFSPEAALDHVSLSKSGIDLSAQGLAQRADAMGNATVDVAQNFITSFAQQLLGDSANGAKLSFDSASLETSSSYAALARHSAGASGSTDAAAFSLNESSHFIGKGTITTADGQSFDFEIEVQYESRTAAAATQSSGAAQDGGLPQDASGATAPAGASGQANHAGNTGNTADKDGQLPTVQLPALNFPGSLDNLLQLLGHQIQSNLSATSDGGAQDASAIAPGGTLKLRLLHLISSSTLLDAATKPASDAAINTGDAQTAAAAAARTKALANAYGGSATPGADTGSASASDDTRNTAADTPGNIAPAA